MILPRVKEDVAFHANPEEETAGREAGRDHVQIGDTGVALVREIQTGIATGTENERETETETETEIETGTGTGTGSAIEIEIEIAR